MKKTVLIISALALMFSFQVAMASQGSNGAPFKEILKAFEDFKSSVNAQIADIESAIPDTSEFVSRSEYEEKILQLENRLSQCDCGETPEICDGLDNDNDGLTDEDFDLLNDNANCGECGTTCSENETCNEGTCTEEVIETVCQESELLAQETCMIDCNFDTDCMNACTEYLSTDCLNAYASLSQCALNSYCQSFTEDDEYQTCLQTECTDQYIRVYGSF